VNHLILFILQNIVGQSDFGCGGITDPVLLELMQHACKEAALSQMDKEQILDAIVPPREWEEDGKFFKQLVSVTLIITQVSVILNHTILIESHNFN